MQSIQDRVRAHFPTGNVYDGVADLVFGNEAFMKSGRTSFAPQHPRVVIDNCGKIPAEIVHGHDNLGVVFDVSARGLSNPREHLGSVSYPFEHLGDPAPAVLEILVHSCVRDGLCRASAENVVNLQGARERSLSASWRDDLKIIDTAHAALLPQHDVLHARATSAQIVSYSPKIKALLASGQLLLAEAFYDNSNGAVSYSSFITSNAPGRAIPEDLLKALARGDRVADADLIHPSLAGLNALIVGNRSFQDHFHVPVPTEYVVFGCADSRTSPYIIFNAPNGLIEVIRNAGNVVNEAVMGSLLISVEDALRFKDEVHLVILAHSRCGAVNATLSCGDHSHSDSAEPDTAAPIVKSLTNRLQGYKRDFPNFKEGDPQLLEASQYNAIEAALEIANFPGRSGDALREILATGRVRIVPARYRLMTGRVDFFDPLPVASGYGGISHAG